MSDLEQFGMSVPEDCPKPVGYKVLVLPYSGPEKTPGGIILADVSKDANKYGAVIAYVIELGEDCYSDGDKFPNGPWCKEGDWVVIGKFVGKQISVSGTEVRLMNDDEILALVPNPSVITRSSI